jgi:pimeloyl-ACP methyl ester carboxylesterase
MEKKAIYQLQYPLFTFLLCICGFIAHAQVQLEVDPAATDRNISKVHTPHVALYNNAVKTQRKLVLMIPGTGASAFSCMDFQKSLRDMGFHVIGLDYANKVITTACTESSDSACFDHFRQEIVFGTPVSEKTTVDSTNSIYNRFYKLLVYLNKNDPAGQWDTFLSGGQIKWSNVIVTGHSQGAGHAAYLAKRFKVARAVMLSGPQDYFSKLDRPAPWLSDNGKTPKSRLYAFLHKDDPFNCSWQMAGNIKLRKNAIDTVSVHPDLPVSHGHILLTDVKTKSPHGASLLPVFEKVWKYLFLSK